MALLGVCVYAKTAIRRFISVSITGATAGECVGACRRAPPFHSICVFLSVLASGKAPRVNAFRFALCWAPPAFVVLLRRRGWARVGGGWTGTSPAEPPPRVTRALLHCAATHASFLGAAACLLFMVSSGATRACPFLIILLCFCLGCRCLRDVSRCVFRVARALAVFCDCSCVA